MLYALGHDKYGAKGAFNDYGQNNPFHQWLPLKLRDRETVRELEKIYTLMGVADNFRNHFHNGGHEAETETVINFWGKYL